MKINESLNLVVPLVSERVTRIVDGKEVAEDVVRVHGYHIPISREVFEANYRILAATKAYLYSNGAQFLMVSGPRIASLTLRDEARKDAVQRGDVDKDGKPSEAAADALLQEIKRLTTILAPGAQGWEPIPVDSAIQRGIIDAEDWREAESSLVFFTFQSALATKAERTGTTKATASLLKAVSTSSSLMEFAASLPTSTSDAPTETKAVSSLPS